MHTHPPDHRTGTTAGPRRARHAARLVAATLVAVLAVLAASVLSASPAAAFVATYRTTDDISLRTSPTAAPTGVYGIPRGAAFGVICQTIGQPHGRYGNTLYFLATYNGRNMYIPDAWTDSPHLANQPPIAGIPMCGAAPAPAPGPAPAPAGAGTYASRASQLRLCTNTGNGNCVPAGMGVVAPGARLSMVCWKKGSWFTGDYGTDMWFWVQSPQGEGYVTASVVRRQTRVPSCDSKPSFVAAEAALARVGQIWASGGDLAGIGAGEWAPGPFGEWSGDCPKLPFVAWRAAGMNVVRLNAIQNYRWWAARVAMQTSSPPRGAITFWNVTSFGHTAIALGNGFVASTTGMDGNRTPNVVRHYTAWPRFLGWAQPA